MAEKVKGKAIICPKCGQAVGLEVVRPEGGPPYVVIEEHRVIEEFKPCPASGQRPTAKQST